MRINYASLLLFKHLKSGERFELSNAEALSFKETVKEIGLKPS